MKRKIKLKERIFMSIKLLLFIPILFLFFSNFTFGVEMEGNESRIKQIENVKTLRFEDIQPSSEEFRLLTKKENKIFYVCENCEYKDLKEALGEASLGDTIIITDRRKYKIRFIRNSGITIDCNGSTLEIEGIDGSFLTFKNCKFETPTIWHGLSIAGNNVEIANSIINDIYLHGNETKIVNSYIHGGILGAPIIVKLPTKENKTFYVCENCGIEKGIEIKNSQITGRIELHRCENAKIEGNTINQTLGGIYLETCKDVEISGNTIRGWESICCYKDWPACCEGYGIHIYNSRKVSITGNKISNYWWGIWIDCSKEIELKENSFEAIRENVSDSDYSCPLPEEELREVTKKGEVGCKEDEVYNPETKKCIKKGIGCYSDTECYHFYSNSSVICYGSVHNHVNIPGHCCLKNEIWNGTACIERKLRIVVIPYKESWSQIGISDNDIKEIISSAFSYYPIRKEKVEVIIWKNPCNPPVDYLLWRFCPLFVGAAGYGDRYVIVTSKNEDLSSECGSDSMGGCAILNGETVIIREFTPTVVAHEIGHTFGLRDEYCQYKHPIFGWLCGTEAYPNPLKEEYGCRVFPLPRCEKAMLEAEKQTASPGEWIKVNIKDLQGSACEVYKAKIEVLKNGDWQLLSTCSPGEPCYVSFSENEKGTNKIRAKLVYTGYPFISSEIITNEVEINVQGSTTKSKIFGYSCDDNKLLLSLNVPFGTYWEIYGNGKEIWFRVEKNSNFSYELNGKFEIYDIACNKIGEGKMNVEKNGIYNIKVYGPLTSTSLPPRIEKLGFCCWDANVYDATCLGNTAISGGGRSIMASLITPRTHFSKPAWEHLKKVMEIWE